MFENRLFCGQLAFLLGIVTFSIGPSELGLLIGAPLIFLGVYFAFTANPLPRN
jgi:hypothetical protein